MRVLRNEILRRGPNVCKIAPAAGRDQYRPAHLGIMLDDQHASSALAGLNGAKQPGRTPADNDRVKPH
jgi:hypothetical protein